MPRVRRVELGVYCDAPSHYTPEKYRVTQCRDCSMVFTNPQFAFYEEVAENRGAPAEVIASAAPPVPSSQASFTLSLIKPFVSGRRILDFGCGRGSFVGAALREGWDARGYDVNVGGIQTANRRWQTDVFESGPFEQYAARWAGQFDAVVSLQVFEHLTNPIGLGRQVMKVLKPGGVFLIDVPNVNQLREWRRKGITLDPTAHVCHFSAGTLPLLMEKIGATVVYCSAAPSFFGFYRRVGLGKLAYSLGKLSKAVLPGIGTGVCVIGRKD